VLLISKATLNPKDQNAADPIHLAPSLIRHVCGGAQLRVGLGQELLRALRVSAQRVAVCTLRLVDAAISLHDVTLSGGEISVTAGVDVYDWTLRQCDSAKAGKDATNDNANEEVFHAVF